MNKRIILILILGIFLFSIVSARPVFHKYYRCDLSYENGSLEINSIDVVFLENQIRPYFGSKSAVVYDSKGKVLNLTKFEVPNEVFWESVDDEGNFNDSGISFLNSIDFYVYVPYYDNSAEIEIYDSNKLSLIKEDISMFSDKEKIEEDLELIEESEKRNNSEKRLNISEEDKSSDDDDWAEKISDYWWVFVIILLSLVIVLVRSLSKKEKK